MSQQSISPIWNQEFVFDHGLAGIVEELTAVIHVHLFTDAPGTITPFTAVADFTEAAFNGYAPKNITIAGGVTQAISPNSNAVVVAANVLFVSAAISPPGETILGYYVTDSTDAVLYFSEYFPEPIEITALGQLIDLLVSISSLMVGSIA